MKKPWDSQPRLKTPLILSDFRDAACDNHRFFHRPVSKRSSDAAERTRADGRHGETESAIVGVSAVLQAPCCYNDSSLGRSVENAPAFIPFGWGTGLAVRHDRSLVFAALIRFVARVCNSKKLSLEHQ